MPDFQHPYILLSLLPLAVIAVLFFLFKLNTRSIAVPLSSQTLVTPQKSISSRIYSMLPILRFASIALLILSLARPGTRVTYTDVTSHGIDIMLVQDISLSMLGIDFVPNRLSVAKEVVKDFVLKRVNDRLGIVVFSGEAFLQCPLTSDHEIINDLIDEVDFDIVSEDMNGTAIGNALGLAAARLSDSDAASKIILLITDGENNRGAILPETAAEACAKLGIRIYVIGIGTEGIFTIVIPRGQFQGAHRSQQSFDIKTMQALSDITGGRYFLAGSSDEFRRTLDEIDRLEKSDYEIRTSSEFSDSFYPYVVAAVLLFIIEFFVRAFILRKIP